MNWLRRNPFFYTVLAAILGVACYGLVRSTANRSRLEALKNEYETKRTQYERYVSAQPAPTKANLEALEANYEELYSEFEDAMEALNLNSYDRDDFFGTTPRSRTDAFFEIAQFVERARRHAQSNRVALGNDDRFGFNAYANIGPPTEELEQAHHQLKIVAVVLEALFDSGIETFVKVQRGASTSNKNLGTSNSRGSSISMEGDLFLFGVNESLGKANVIETTGIRIAFKGQFAALRNFINALGISRLPFVVRGIEVDLASETGAKAGLETFAVNPFAVNNYERFAEKASSVPIIANNTSLFIVTLEFLDLKASFPPPVAANESEEATDV